VKRVRQENWTFTNSFIRWLLFELSIVVAPSLLLDIFFIYNDERYLLQ